jgi:Pyruvate/2-oxoacid:ferredoxin oxidoreductase delta subunit
VIPVEKTVYGGIKVFPYEDAGRYIDEAEAISVSTCYCRHKQRLLGKGCEYPHDVCLQFGSFARFVVQRGFGREISKEEARRILERCREAGLIHTSNNTRDHIDFICNCCSCCCGILYSVQSSTMPSMAASSNYLARVDEDRCVACGTCVERCQMGAMRLEGDTAEVDEGRCIGCGVCADGCPSEAMALVRKERVTEPAKDFRELVMRQLEDKKRLGLLSSG